MLRGLSAAVFIAGRGVPGCGSPLLRDRKAAAMIYPPLLPNPIKWRSSGPGRRGAREPGGGGGKDGAKEGRTNGPSEGGRFGFIYSRGFFFFPLMVSFSSTSFLAPRTSAMPGWLGLETGRPTKRCPEPGWGWTKRPWEKTCWPGTLTLRSSGHGRGRADGFGCFLPGISWGCCLVSPARTGDPGQGASVST